MEVEFIAADPQERAITPLQEILEQARTRFALPALS
jgi:hypothetical protein